MKEVLRTHNLAHAHSFQAALEGAGIDSRLHGDQAGYAVGISVIVTNESDATEALAILKHLEQPDTGSDSS